MRSPIALAPDGVLTGTTVMSLVGRRRRSSSTHTLVRIRYSHVETAHRGEYDARAAYDLSSARWTASSASPRLPNSRNATAKRRAAYSSARRAKVRSSMSRGYTRQGAKRVEAGRRAILAPVTSHLERPTEDAAQWSLAARS